MEELIRKEEIIHLRDKCEKHELRIAELEKNHSLQQFQYNSIMESLKEMKQDISEIKATPTKRWDLIITTGLTALITYIFTKIAR